MLAYMSSGNVTTMTKLPISVCMISGAEAGRIGRALASVRDWTAEIVVVLNENVADGTAELAGGFGGKVYREPWKGFVRQKNSAAAKATQKWLLNLDADEEVSPALRRDIEQALANPGPHVAFTVPRCTFYCGRWIRHGDWYPDRGIRIWQKEKGEWGGIDPHAKLEARGPVGRLRGDLLHYSFDNIDHQISKIIPYSNDFVNHRLKVGGGASVWDLSLRPAWRFFRAYLIKRGFLDGWQGYYIAWVNAFATATRYAKVRESLQAQSKTSPCHR
jgi:glycosyltransferase involved in cell wall biosynthesis